MTNRITPNGELIRQEPAKFGSIGNAHHVDLDGPWTHSIEPMFDEADSIFPDLIIELLQLESVLGNPDGHFISRFSKPLSLAPNFDRLLPECLASLVVRSPRFRNIIVRGVNHFGFYPEGVSDRHLIVASSIGNCFPSIISSLRNCGLIFIFYSDDTEFVFGDGFLHNFTSHAHTLSNVKLVIPLTPQMAIAYTSPSGPYRRGLRTLRMGRSEVEIINFLTQLYSEKYLFFRSQKPNIDRTYFNGIFMQLKYHKSEFIEQIREAFSIPTFPRSNYI